MAIDTKASAQLLRQAIFEGREIIAGKKSWGFLGIGAKPQGWLRLGFKNLADRDALIAHLGEMHVHIDVNLAKGHIDVLEENAIKRLGYFQEAYRRETETSMFDYGRMALEPDGMYYQPVGSQKEVHAYNGYIHVYDNDFKGNSYGKFHLSLPNDDVPKAWNAISNRIISDDMKVSCKVISPNGIKLLENRHLAKGKSLVLYFDSASVMNKTPQWQKLLLDVEDTLHQHGIPPGHEIVGDWKIPGTRGYSYLRTGNTRYDYDKGIIVNPYAGPRPSSPLAQLDLTPPDKGIHVTRLQTPVPEQEAGMQLGGSGEKPRKQPPPGNLGTLPN